MGENRTQYQNDYKRLFYKRVPLELRREDYDIIKRCAEKKGVPINRYIKTALYYSLVHDLGDDPELPRLWSSLGS